MDTMQETNATGFVYRMGPGIFGVLSYHPCTMVQVAMFRDDIDSASEAAKRLEKRFEGRTFKVADSGQEKWGAVCFKAQGSAVLI